MERETFWRQIFFPIEGNVESLFIKLLFRVLLSLGHIEQVKPSSDNQYFSPILV